MRIAVRRAVAMPGLRTWAESLWRPAAHALGIRIDDPVGDHEYIVGRNAYIVRADLPGVDPNRDLDLTVHRRVLTINVRHGALNRSILLPASTDEDEITAEYTDGVLSVRLPVIIPRACRAT